MLWVIGLCLALARWLVGGALIGLICAGWPLLAGSDGPSSGGHAVVVISFWPIGLRLTSAAAQLACKVAFWVPM